MTKQEIFDRAVAGLASQGFKRAGNDRICQYRSDDGCRKCAVGWLIPDEKYSVTFEGQAIHTYVLFAADDWYEGEKAKQRAILDAAGIPLDREVVYFVEELQSAHDKAYDWVEGEEVDKQVDKPAKMRASLRKLAEDNALTIPEVLNG